MLTSKIRENPSQYGLKQLTAACQPVIYGVKPACASPDEYYFWDESHYSQHIHQIIGESMAELYGQ